MQKHALLMTMLKQGSWLAIGCRKKDRAVYPSFGCGSGDNEGKPYRGEKPAISSGIDSLGDCTLVGKCCSHISME